MLVILLSTGSMIQYETSNAVMGFMAIGIGLGLKWLHDRHER